MKKYFYILILLSVLIVVLSLNQNWFSANLKIDNLELANRIEETLQKLDPIIVLYTQRRDRSPMNKPFDKWKMVTLAGSHGTQLREGTEFLERYGTEKIFEQYGPSRNLHEIKNGRPPTLSNVSNVGANQTALSPHLRGGQSICSWFKRYQFAYYPDLLRNKIYIYKVPEKLAIQNNKVSMVVKNINSEDRRTKLTFNLLRGALPETCRIEKYDSNTKEWKLFTSFDVIKWQRLDDGTYFPKTCELYFWSRANNRDVPIITKLEVLQVVRPESIEEIIEGFESTEGYNFTTAFRKASPRIEPSTKDGMRSVGRTDYTLVERALGMKLEEFYEIYEELEW